MTENEKQMHKVFGRGMLGIATLYLAIFVLVLLV